MLSKKEEQCTCLSRETEKLKIQLSGERSVKIMLILIDFLSCIILHKQTRKVLSSFFLPFLSGLEAKLKSGEEKLEQLTKDKAKLEDNISELIKSSGDSSTQLTKMNEDLTQKERLDVININTHVCKIIILHYGG